MRSPRPEAVIEVGAGDGHDLVRVAGLDLAIGRGEVSCGSPPADQ